MKGRCESCKHWSREAIRPAIPDDIGTGRIPYKQRACLNVIDGAYDHWGEGPPTPTAEGLTRLPDDLAFINVYEVWPNQLMTGPKFGCIHWEQDTRDEPQRDELPANEDATIKHD